MVTAEDILSIIRKNDIKVDLKALDHSELLSEQGLDSLDITSILFTIEDKFKIKISEEDLEQNKLSSINLIVSHINSATKSSVKP